MIFPVKPTIKKTILNEYLYQAVSDKLQLVIPVFNHIYYKGYVLYKKEKVILKM